MKALMLVTTIRRARLWAFAAGALSRKPGRDQVSLGRNPVIGQTIPGRKPQQLGLGQAKPQQGRRPRQSLVVAGDKDHRAIGVQRDIGGEKGLGPVRHFTNQDRLTTT